MSNMNTNTTTTMMNTNTNVFPVKHNTNTNIFVKGFIRNDFVNKPPSDGIVRNLDLKLTMFETEMRSNDIKKQFLGCL